MQCKQQFTTILWIVVGPSLNVQSHAGPHNSMGHTPCLSNMLYFKVMLAVCGVPLSGCSLQTSLDNHCTMCLWAAQAVAAEVA